MGIHHNLAVFRAAELIAEEVAQLVDHAPRRLINAARLSAATRAVMADIDRGYEQNMRADRIVHLRSARHRVEETIRYLRDNYRASRIPESTYWRLRDRLVTVSKMLKSLAES